MTQWLMAFTKREFLSSNLEFFCPNGFHPRKSTTILGKWFVCSLRNTSICVFALFSPLRISSLHGFHVRRKNTHSLENLILWRMVVENDTIVFLGGIQPFFQE